MSVSDDVGEMRLVIFYSVCQAWIFVIIDLSNGQVEPAVQLSVNSDFSMINNCFETYFTAYSFVIAN